jgi:hypothetical protein
MRTVAEGTAYANQTEIPVPGGFVSGMTDVIVGGADLGSGDYDDTNSMSIKLTVPMVVGTMFKVVAWTPNQTVVNAGGQLAGFRNKVINGNFDIWQRGTSFSNAASVAGAYCADRFQAYRSAFATGIVAQQLSGVGGLTGSYYALQVIRSNGDASTAAFNVGTSFETIDVRKMIGQQFTLSYNIFGSGNFIGLPLYCNVFTGTGTDSSMAAGFTASSLLASTSKVLTSGWQKVSFTFTVPAGATQFGMNWSLTPSGTAGSGDWFAIAQVQMEVGGVATQFEQRPIGLELALCQRFFQKSYRQVDPPGTNTGLTNCIFDITGIIANVRFPVVMRTTPTIATYDRNGAIGKVTIDGTTDNVTPSNVDNQGDCGFKIYHGGATRISFHYTASAEL